MAEFGITEPVTSTEAKIVYSHSPNTIGNYSNVYMEVWQRKPGGVTSTGTFAGSNNIDGYGYSFSWYGSYNGWTMISASSRTVYHNSDGTRSVWIGTSYSNSGTSQAGTYSGGATITLTNIDRTAPTFTTHSINSVTTTSITVNRVNNVACDQVQYSLNGGAWTSTTTGSTYTISGLTSNTSYTIKTRARKTSNQVWGESSTLTQQTHPVTVNPTVVTYTKPDPFSVRVDVRTDATDASPSVLTGCIHKVFITVNGVTQEANLYKYNLGTGSYADAGYWLFDELNDNTNYQVDITVTTARSLVDSSMVSSVTTDPADFIKIVYPNGTVSGLKPCYRLASNNTLTRVKTTEIEVLPPTP